MHAVFDIVGPFHCYATPSIKTWSYLHILTPDLFIWLPIKYIFILFSISVSSMSTSQPSSDDAYLCGTTPHGYTTHESQTFSHTSIDTVSILSSSSIDTAEVEGVVKEISLNQALFNELRSQEALPGQPLAQTLSGQLQDQAQPGE